MVLSDYLTAYVRFILRHRLAVILAIALVTVLSAFVLPQAVVASSLRSMFFDETHTGFERYKARARQFGSDEVMLFGVRETEPLSKENLTRLESLHRSLEGHPHIARVTSIASLERIGLVDDTIAVRDLAEEATRAPQRAPELLEEIRGDPIAGGLLQAREEGHFAVVVELTVDSTRKAEDGPIIIGDILSAFADAGYARANVFPGGTPVIMAEMIEISFRNILRLFPLVIFCLLIAVYLMFGRFWPVFVTTASALVAVVWTMAFAISRDPHINILMTLVPCLVMIISFSDVVHLCSAYLLEIDRGREKVDAIVDATAEVGAACLLTSLTTAVGFFAIVFVPAPSFRQLGLATGVGVLVAYALAMSLVPILLYWFRCPEPWRNGRGARVQAALDAVLGTTARLTTTRPWTVIALFVIFIAGASWGAAQIEFETDFSKRLDADNPVRVDQRFLEQHFARTTLIDTFVEVDEEEGVLDPAVFNRVVELEQRIEAHPRVDKVVSLVDLMRATHQALVNDPDASFTPLSGEAIAQMMVLLEMQGVDALAPFVDFSRKTLRLTVYSRESGIVAQHAQREEIEAMGAQTMGELAGVEATGVGPLLGAWVEEILAGQRRGLGFSLTIIMLMLMVGYRSIRAGFWSMIPNLLPLLAVAAWCGYFWDKVDSDTLIAAMIALGIGVDDTIHFVARFRLEASRGGDITEQLERTFRYSGRGIFITTFVFVVGFAPLMTSDYFSIWAMGALLPMCFVVALLADLLLVPAMIRVGFIRA